MPPTHRGGLPVKRKLRCYCGEFGFLVALSPGLDGGSSLWAALPAWPLSQFQFSHCRIRGHTSSARVHSDGRWQRLVRSGEPANVARHPALGSAAAGASPVTAAIAAACSRHRRTYTPGGSRARKWRACAAAASRPALLQRRWQCAPPPGPEPRTRPRQSGR